MRKLRRYILIFTLVCTIVLVFALPNVLSIFTGSFNLSSGPLILFNAVAFALACLCFCLFTLQKGFKFINILKASGVVAAALLVAFLVGLLMQKAFASAQSSAVKGICSFGMIIMSILAIMMLYLKGRLSTAKKAQAMAIRRSAASVALTKYSLVTLFGTYLITILSSLVFLIIGVDSQPLASIVIYTSASLLLWRLTAWRGWTLFAIIASLINSLFFCINSFVSDAMANLSVLLPISVLVTILLLPLADLYTRQEEAL